MDVRRRTPCPKTQKIYINSYNFWTVVLIGFVRNTEEHPSDIALQIRLCRQDEPQSFFYIAVSCKMKKEQVSHHSAQNLFYPAKGRIDYDHLNKLQPENQGSNGGAGKSNIHEENFGRDLVYPDGVIQHIR